MAVDSILPVRRAVLTYLKGVDALTATVPADRIYAQQVTAQPEWPFLRYETIGPNTPIVATCLDGQQVIVRIHAFAKPRIVARAPVETAEDCAARIITIVSDALDRRRMTIDRGHMHIAWQGSAMLQDRSEASVFHAFADFRIRCMTR